MKAFGSTKHRIFYKSFQNQTTSFILHIRALGDSVMTLSMAVKHSTVSKTYCEEHTRGKEPCKRDALYWEERVNIAC